MNMGRRGVLVAVIAGTAVVAACAAASPGLPVSLVRGPGHPEAGRASSIVVRAPAAAKVRIWIARGQVTRSFATHALAHGRCRGRVVFPRVGRWTFGARAGGARVRLGSVRVRARAVPLTFAWPTSVDVEPDGSLLLVENGNGRVLRIDPVTGKTAAVTSADRAYALAHGPSGAVYLSAGKSLLRLDGAGGATPVAQAPADIGPVAVAANGDVYYTTETQAWRLAGGAGAPVQVAAGLSGPHGIAVTSDGGLLVSDTGRHRVERIDLATGHAETWGDLGEPRGIAIARDGETAYVVDAGTHCVVHLRIDGKRLGLLKPVFSDPYAVATGRGGSVYVVDTAASGRLYRVGRDGTTTAVSRSG
jgi:DNA-binding beta-propeller fold protein YncE